MSLERRSAPLVLHSPSSGGSRHAVERGDSWRFLWALRLGIGLARLIPSWLFVKTAGLCGRVLGAISPDRAVVADNLQRIEAFARALPEHDRPVDTRPGHEGVGGQVCVEDVFASYGRYWGEFLAVAAHPELMKRLRVRVEGEEHLRDAAARGPVCILTGHLGNWDLGARWVSARLPGFAVLAEPLRPPALFQLCSRLRERAGCVVLPAEGGGMRLYRHLSRGGHAGVVADRVFGAGEEEVDFLGAQRLFPGAGIRMARHAGARLLPAFFLREGAGYLLRVHPPIDDREDPVRRFARTLESEILACPGQWCVLRPLHDGRLPQAAAVS